MAFLFVIACSSSNSSENNTQEQDLVKAAFEGYKAAILKDAGNEAVQFLDSKTIQYYSELLETVLNADSAKVSSLNIMDKLQTLTVRALVDKEKLLSFDGKQLLAHTIEIGMTSKSVAGSQLENIVIDKDFAKGQFSANGEEAPVYFSFHKEEGDWKLDLTSIFHLSTTVFQQMIKESGQNENEFIISILEPLVGTTPKNDLWHPVN